MRGKIDVFIIDTLIAMRWKNEGCLAVGQDQHSTVTGPHVGNARSHTSGPCLGSDSEDAQRQDFCRGLPSPRAPSFSWTRSFPLRVPTLGTSIALFRLSRSLRAKTLPDPHPAFSDLEEVRASVMFGPTSLHDG